MAGSSPAGISSRLSSAAPLLVRLDFSAAFRPMDLLGSADPRLLTIRITDLELIGSRDKVLHRWRIEEGEASGMTPLVGLSPVEGGSVWNNGRHAAFLLARPGPTRAGDRVRIRYAVATLFEGDCWVDVGCDGEPTTCFALDGSAIDIALTPRNREVAPVEQAIAAVIRAGDDPAATIASAIALAGALPAASWIVIASEARDSDASRAIRTALPKADLLLVDASTPAGEMRNLGVERAATPLVLMIDAGVLVDRSTVSRLVAVIGEDDHVAAVGPLLLDAFGQVAAGSSPDMLVPAWWVRSAEGAEALSLNPACLLVRRAALDAVGGYDATLADGADRDLASRLARYGAAMRLVADAAAIRSAATEGERCPALHHRELLAARPIRPVRSKAGEEAGRPSRVTTLIALCDGSGEVLEAALRCAAALDDAALWSAFPVSAARVAQVAAELGFPDAPPIVDEVEAQRSRSETLLCIARTIPPDLAFIEAVRATRRLLYFVSPAHTLHIPEGVRNDRLRTLAECDGLFADTRHALTRLLAEAAEAEGAAFRERGNVLPPSYNESAPAESRSEIIAVDLRIAADRTAQWASSLAMVERFRAAGNAAWRCAIIVRGASDSIALGDLRATCAKLDQLLLVDPPRATLDRLLARASIYVATADTHAADLVEAVALGCCPVAPTGSASAESCEEAGGPLYRPEALADALGRAAAATAQGWTAPPAFAARHAPEAFARRLRALIANTSADQEGPAPPTPAYLVLGMHRSGTSAMARILSLATGAAMPHTLMPEQPDNPTGFWESPEVAALNDRLLEGLGTRWYDPFAYLAVRRAGLPDRAMIDAARATLRREMPPGPIVLKDPRISLLAPTWLEALRLEGYAPRVMTMVRSPWEVARSLQRRNGSSLAEGFLAWTSHVLAVRRGVGDRNLPIIPYPTMLADPSGAVRRLLAGWGGEMVEDQSAIDAFVQPDLRSHHEPGDARSAAFAMVWALFDALMREAETGTVDAAAFAHAEQWLEELAEVTGTIIAPAPVGDLS